MTTVNAGAGSPTKEELHVTTSLNVTMSNVPSKQKLALCFFGIFVSYFIYGLLQEKM